MFEELDVFSVVVEQSSLNKASKLLNLSQPALSRKIAKLEDQLGVQLFNRRGKRLELTSIGQLAYTYALEQRQQQLKFMQTLAHYRGEEQITITLGASLTTLQTTLPPLVNAFMEKHPSAEIKLVTGKTHEIVSYVRDKRVDVGIVASSINQPGLNCIPLFDDHLELVVPTTHPLADSLDVGIEQLQGMPMIIFSTGTWYRKLTDDLFHRCGIMPDIRMEIDSFEAIVRLIPTCKAAALLPKSYLRPQLLSDNGLVDIHIPALVETRRTTSLIYGNASELSNAANRWIAETEVLFRELQENQQQTT
ncbi:LysR family transcriptional regulator [Paenibacillus sp. EC2-1]|uniref:LysR family transcriptional regulator n=1 Tax=Paenibacillus sp. EC2-1 TaxID=3388665 RepID=UPI003BEF2CA6